MDEELQARRYADNIRYYPWFKFCLGMMIFGPVLTPYLLAKGLSYSQIMLLQSISAVSTTLFEVPTGVVADKVSRKLSLCLPGLCLGVAIMIYIYFDEFYMLALGEVVVGLGITFRSGADSAFLHESLDRLGRKGEFAAVEGRANSLIFAGQGVGTLFSSLLYTLHPDIPFWFSVGGVLSGSVVALLFTETEREGGGQRYGAHLLGGLQLTIKNSTILWIVFLAALLGFVYRTAFWLYEPYFSLVDIEVVWFGVIFSVYNLIAALAARYLPRYAGDHRKVLLGLGLLMACTYLLPALFVSRWSLMAIGLQQIFRGLYRPTLNAYINNQVEDRYRATVPSIVGLAVSLSYALLSPLVGWGLDHRGVEPTYGCMGVVALAGIGALAFWGRRKSN